MERPLSSEWWTVGVASSAAVLVAGVHQQAARGGGARGRRAGALVAAAPARAHRHPRHADQPVGRLGPGPLCQILRPPRPTHTAFSPNDVYLQFRFVVAQLAMDRRWRCTSGAPGIVSLLIAPTRGSFLFYYYEK